MSSKSIAMKCARISAITYFSNRNTKTIAPLYKSVLEIVCESLRERMDFHPDFLTLLQMPKQVSKMIAKIATITSGLTGVKIVSTEKTNSESLVFIH